MKHSSPSTIMILHELEGLQSKVNCLLPDRCMGYIVNKFEKIGGGSQVNTFEVIQGGSLCEQRGPQVFKFEQILV